MSGGMIAFIVWGLCGGFFLVIGVCSFRAEEPVGFWANVKAPSAEEIADVKAYNRSVGRLWCAFGAGLILLGLPLLEGQNSPWILLSLLGSLWAVIVLAVVYMKIERKYRKR